MKRFLIFLVLSVFILASCNNKSDNTSVIIFKDHDGVIIQKSTNTSLNEVIYPNNPKRTGYSFEEWELTSDESKEIIYSAIYSPNEYVISFDEADIPDISITYDNSIGKLSKLEKEGYIFEGWYYQDVLIDESTIYKFDHSIKLTASWIAETYKIEYYIDDEFSEFTLVHYNQEVKELLIPEKKHHHFVGWDLDGEILPLSFVFKYTSNIKLNAIFEPIVYTIEFNDEFGYSELIRIKHGEITEIIPELSHPDYDFLGWFLENEKVASQFTFNYENDIVLTTKWQIKSYFINYNENEGEALNSQKINKYEEIKLLPTPYRKDYVFEGWYLDGEELEAPFTYEFANDITLEAKWNIKEFDIYYNYKNFDPTHTYANQVIKNLPTVFKPDYKFLGWSFDEEILEVPFIFTFNKDIILEPVFELKANEFILNNEQTLDINIDSSFVYIIDHIIEIPIIFGETYYFDLEDKITISYVDSKRETLEKVSISNNYYFNGLLINGKFIEGEKDYDRIAFDLTTIYNLIDEETLRLEIVPAFEKLYDIKIVSLYQGNRIDESSYLFDFDGEKYSKFKAIKGLEINIIALEEKIGLDQVQYLFDYFVSETNTLTIKGNTNEASFIVDEGGNLVKSIFKVENVLVRILMTEQDCLYNNQPVSFNGITINFDSSNFSSSDVNQKPVIETYLRPGEISITLITGRKDGIVESPGLFLLSKHFSKLPENTILNGAFTKPVNSEERNRFYEHNNKYVNIAGENYSEVIFTIDEDKTDFIEIKLSFVPVYAFNENGLNTNEGTAGALDFEVNNIADFGTMSEILRFEDNEYRYLIMMNAKFTQLADIKAEHIFGGLGNQAVFVRPVEVTGFFPWLTYDGGNHEIQNANIFIGLHQDGGDFAIFVEGNITVSNLVVNNTTIVRGEEINSTINEAVLIKRYNGDIINGRYEYKLRIGGVSSGTRALNNVTANNLNVNFGKLIYIDENNNRTEKEVLAYIGGIAGVTAIISERDPVSQGGLAPSITKSLFTGDITLTNVKGVIGGLAGLNVGVIRSSKSESNIVSSGYIGGLVGENRGVITTSTFAGNIKGYGIVGGITALNNTMLNNTSRTHTPTYSLINNVNSNILSGLVEVLGPNQNQIPIWNFNNEEKNYNNYGAGFIAVSDVTIFAGNFSNSTSTIVKGERVSPFIGLLSKEYQIEDNMSNVGFNIADNYFVGYENTINPNMKVMGYRENDEFSLEFVNTFVKINNNLIYSTVANNQNLLESFLENTSYYSMYQKETDLEITNRDKFEEMIGGQNIDYPYLVEGYGNHLYTYDIVGIGFYQLTNGSMWPEYNLFRDWEVNAHYKTSSPILDSMNYALNINHFEFQIIKFTKIKIDITRLFDNDDIYYLTNYHRTYALGGRNSIVNPVLVDNSSLQSGSNIETGSNQQTFTLEFSSDSDILNESVMHEILFQFADISTLDLSINNHTHIQNYEVYEVSGDSETHERFRYNLEKNFSLNSVNKSMFTTEVKVEVQALDLVDFNTVRVLRNTYIFDINDIENMFEELVGLDIKINKHFNAEGYEILDFQLDIKGAYRINISTKSSIRVALSVTGVDEEMQGEFVSEVRYSANRNNNNYGSAIIPIVQADNLNRVIVEIPISDATNSELTSIGISANTSNLNNDYAMAVEYITVNGVKVAENEFDLDLNQEFHNATHYVNGVLSIDINLQDYFVEGSDKAIELRENYVALDLNTHFDYAVHRLYIDTMDRDSDHQDHPLKYISYNLELNMNETNDNIDNNPQDNIVTGNLTGIALHKNHKDGVTIRLLGLENPAPHYPNYTFPSDVYKIIGKDRLVRVQLMASSKYATYNAFVLQEGRNPNELDTNVILTGGLTINTGPMDVREYYININVYEVYEIEIKTDLTEDSLGISKGITPDIMPIAKLANDINNSVEFRTADNGVPRLNMYAQISSEVREDNSFKMLLEHGARVNLTSSKDNIAGQIDNDRLLFDSWKVYAKLNETTSDSENEVLFITNPIKYTKIIVAEYRVKSVKIHYNIDASYTHGTDGFGVLLPEIKSANPNIQYEKVVRQIPPFYSLGTKYMVGDRDIIRIRPYAFLNYREAPVLPFNESGITEVVYRNYVVKDSFRTIEVPYGEELEFVPKDYSQFSESSVNFIRQGPFKLFTYNEQPGHENYLTNISESTPENLNNKFMLLNGENDWFTTNTQTGETISFKGQAMGDFIISSKVLTYREINLGYYYNENTRIQGQNNISSHSGPILTGNNNLELPYQIENARSMFVYNYSNVEIKFNISQIERDHGITVRKLYWDLQMPQNYLGGPDEYFDSFQGNIYETSMVPYKLNHVNGQTKNIDYITYNTFNETIDGDEYVVIRFTLNIIDGIVSNNQDPTWRARVSDLMFASLRINQGTV